MGLQNVNENEFHGFWKFGYLALEQFWKFFKRGFCEYWKQGRKYGGVGVSHRCRPKAVARGTVL